MFSFLLLLSWNGRPRTFKANCYTVMVPVFLLLNWNVGSCMVKHPTTETCWSVMVFLWNVWSITPVSWSVCVLIFNWNACSTPSASFVDWSLKCLVWHPSLMFCMYPVIQLECHISKVLLIGLWNVWSGTPAMVFVLSFNWNAWSNGLAPQQKCMV